MTVGDLFREYGKTYRKSHKLAPHIRKSMVMIEKCATGELGSHQLECDECGAKFLQENSCRNRHCPVCQKEAAKDWAEARIKELLPVSYYHVIFTVPDSLNPIIQTNQKVMYDILFKASAETMMTLIADPKYVGGKGGMLAVLHTWGQNLMSHPHLHCLLPGGAISEDGTYFIEPSSNKYIIPVHVVSDLFKKKFLAFWVEAVENREIKFIGNSSIYTDSKVFQKLKKDLYSKGWVVNIRPPFSTGEVVVKYLGRYVKRVAISNERIIAADGDTVTIKWKDYRDGKNKSMKLASDEFIRRFLLHVLPDRYVKVRYYGFLSNSQRKKKLKICRKILRFRVKKQETQDSITEEESSSSKCICPSCREARKVSKKISIKSPTLKRVIIGKARARP